MDENNINNQDIENTEEPKNDKLEIQYIKKAPVESVFLRSVGGGVLGALIVFFGLLLVPNIRNAVISNGTINNEGSTITNVTKNIVEYSNPVMEVAKNVGSSIVGIKVNYEYSSFFGKQTVSQEGSGIIISTDGYVLTNNHVVDADSLNSDIEILVYLPNSKEPFKATLVGKDKQTDIAILKIDCTDLAAVTLGASSELQVGEMVVAIGNPLGMDFAGSVTVGYVSALNRELADTAGNKYQLIQTDAAINQGNSGGALVNTKGEVIGINTAKIGGTGIEGLGFAIPIDDVKTVIRDLIEYKKVIRPYIGIEGITVDEATKNRYKLDDIGVYVKSVESFSAAEKAGIKIGDIIVKIEDKTVTCMEELNEIKNTHSVGDKLNVTIKRDGKEMKVEITLKEQ